MPDVQHSALTTTELHEPKGVAGASAGKVYVSDSGTSGAWTAREYHLFAEFADVSTSEKVLIAVPYAGTVKRIVTVLAGAITSANAIVTAKNSGASSMGTITITQSGSAEGDVDTLAPSSNNTVTADNWISIETDGASSTARRLWITIVIERSS